MTRRGRGQRTRTVGERLLLFCEVVDEAYSCRAFSGGTLAASVSISWTLKPEPSMEVEADLGDF